MDFVNIFVCSHPSQLSVFVRFENSSLPRIWKVSNLVSIFKILLSEDSQIDFSTHKRQMDRMGVGVWISFRNFFRRKSIVMQISFVMLFFYCFRTKFRGGGQKSLMGQTASGPHVPPLRKKARGFGSGCYGFKNRFFS